MSAHSIQILQPNSVPMRRGQATDFDGHLAASRSAMPLAGSLTSPEKPVENVPLHKGPPQLLQGARTSAYMRTCSELEPPCSFWLLSEYDWMPHIII